MALDPQLIRTFIVLSEELSFSRAAVRLHVAQPWISEQIRRLEEQVGLRLLQRTSRTVELTREGTAFLPHAQAIAAAIDSAEGALQTLRGEGETRVSLASLDYYIAYPERNILIDNFVSDYPGISLRIASGPISQILSPFMKGDYDIVFASVKMVPDDPSLEYLPICNRSATVMVPLEHPFASRNEVTLGELKGCRLAMSPGYSNPHALRTVIAPLIEAGAETVPAPEGSRSIVEEFARARRLMCLRWTVKTPVPEQAGDMAIIPIAGSPLTTTTALWRRRGSLSPGALAFWRSAAVLHRILKARDADPAYEPIKHDMERPLSEVR